MSTINTISNNKSHLQENKVCYLYVTYVLDKTSFSCKCDLLLMDIVYFMCIVCTN